MQNEDAEGLWPEWPVEGLLGSGAYGSVYEVCREDFGHTTRAAAKLIRIPGDPAEVRHLQSMGLAEGEIREYLVDIAEVVMNEISIMESLKGARGIVSIEDFRLVESAVRSEWLIWIRMELLEGVMHYRERCGTLGQEEVVRMGIDLCYGLACCHAQGVIHRDIKPENVFRSSFGEYKLGDFGISRRFDSTVRAMYSRKGSPMYAAPEISRGMGYDARVDIYSLGIVLYQFLNGMRLPLMPDPSAQVSTKEVSDALLRRLRGEKLPPPCDADDALASVVLKACEPDPNRRYATASELGGALGSWLDGDSGPALLDTGTGREGPEDLGGTGAGGPRATIVVAVLCLMALVAVMLTLLSWSEMPRCSSSQWGSLSSALPNRTVSLEVKTMGSTLSV